jgi:hypothetical protein
MKPLLVVFLLFITTAITFAKTLPTGTPALLKLDQNLDADEDKKGSQVSFHTLAAVKYKGQVIIPANTPARGTITKIKNNMIFGIAGKLEVSQYQLQAPNGDWVTLSGTLSRDARDRVVGSLVGGWLIGFPLLVKGQDGKLEAGQEITTYTTQELDY